MTIVNMSQQRLRLLIIAIAVICSVVWFIWWSSASVQAERTFTHLKNAIEKGQASGVLDVLHPAYNFSESWPNQIGENGGDNFGNGAIRLLALRGLTGIFQIQQADPFVFNYNIHDLKAQDDGTYAVTVSITLLTRSGEEPLTFTPPLNGQRFILKQEGWWPSLSIIGHTAFNVKL